MNGNGGKKVNGMNDGMHHMPNMMGMNGGAQMAQMAQMRNMSMGPMGQMSQAPMGQASMGQMSQAPMGQMGNIPAVQGLPAAGMNHPGLQGVGPEAMAGNPYYQQQLAAMMMNQQRSNGNERFHPMMYARPPPEVNYMPAPYHPYPTQPPADPYTNIFSDENTSSCNVM